ncbi:MAG TPA: alpha/beta fold hydrolase [Solirubrobacteraceae bacterium]|jgi:pimeloyl-ACP methyl ester carboxylesterase|nr:alpha/beta fold hydrolase [Solirubrobacteraceae bacterium]
MPTLSVNGTELYHERRGAGEPLLLIMGMSGHSLHWGEPFLGELERDFELILYDHRGVGRSAAESEPFTIARLAEDALALLDALQIERAHVLGISMGGMVAQELALAQPQRILTLTLGATYCGGPGAQFTDDTVVQSLAAAILSGDAERKVRTGWEYNVSPEFATGAGNFERFAEVAAMYPMALAMTLLQVQAIVGHDTSARLGEIAAPTLVVHGTADQMLAVANGEIVAGLIPGARLELLDGVGHLFFWEQPERAAQLVREHVAAARA